MGRRACQTEGMGWWEAVSGSHAGDKHCWSWIKKKLPLRGSGAQGPAGLHALPARDLAEELAFVLDESAQLFLKAQPHSSGLSGPEGIQLSPRVTSGVGGGSTLYPGLWHVQRAILSQHGTMGFSNVCAASCAARRSGNTIRPGKYYVL